MPTKISDIRAAIIAGDAPIWVRDIPFGETGFTVDLELRSLGSRTAHRARDDALADDKTHAETLDAMLAAAITGWSFEADEGGPLPCTPAAVTDWLADPDVGAEFRRAAVHAASRVKAGKLVVADGDA